MSQPDYFAEAERAGEYRADLATLREAVRDYLDARHEAECWSGSASEHARQARIVLSVAHARLRTLTEKEAKPGGMKNFIGKWPTKMTSAEFYKATENE